MAAEAAASVCSEEAHGWAETLLDSLMAEATFDVAAQSESADSVIGGPRDTPRDLEEPAPAEGGLGCSLTLAELEMARAKARENLCHALGPNSAPPPPPETEVAPLALVELEIARAKARKNLCHALGPASAPPPPPETEVAPLTLAELEIARAKARKTLQHALGGPLSELPLVGVEAAQGVAASTACAQVLAEAGAAAPPPVATAAAEVASQALQARMTALKCYMQLYNAGLKDEISQLSTQLAALKRERDRKLQIKAKALN